MAGKNIKHLSAAITAASTTGYITVASTAGFYENAIVWLNNSGQPSRQAVISEVLSSTQLGILFRDTQAGSAPSYGRSNVSAYNGGSVTQHEQFVYNTNDKPLD